MKRILLTALVVLLSASTVSAQDFCNGDFDYDSDVDAGDVEEFLNHFGRFQFNNPCPPDGPTPVPKTGQTISSATGDDGDLGRGVALVTPRFKDNLDGTVTSNQTGLIWLKDADCFGERAWAEAISESNGLADGSCGLTDGSSAGDWRLPNLFELESLRDMGTNNPCLPSGHPFDNVKSNWYWSSTSSRINNVLAYGVGMGYGYNLTFQKSDVFYVWPVRGGH